MASAITQGAFLRARVTNASLDYVGSVTVHASICDAALLADQQRVIATVERTGRRWTTYIIRAAADSGLPHDVISINGPSACYVELGDVVRLACPVAVPPELRGTYEPPCPIDIVDVTDLATNPLPPAPLPPVGLSAALCHAKIHRPRVTSVNTLAKKTAVPTIFVDSDWLRETGMAEHTEVIMTNIRTRGRLVGSVRAAEAGSRRVDVCIEGKIDEFLPGDVSIIMAYADCDWRALLEGEVPPIKVAFPFEKPIYQPPPETENGINVEQIKADRKQNGF